MNYTFLFGVFNKIAKKVKPFENYMEYMFEHKKSSPIRAFKNKERVTPSDLLRCDLMFHTCRDIIQSNPMTVEVGIHAAIISCKDLMDKSKAIWQCSSAIRGAKIMKKILAEK